MYIKNRLANLQADYLLLIVRKPAGWRPTSLDDIPPTTVVLSTAYVASVEEAFEDLIRCNKLSISRNLDEWAVVEHAGGMI